MYVNIAARMQSNSRTHPKAMEEPGDVEVVAAQDTAKAMENAQAGATKRR